MGLPSRYTFPFVTPPPRVPSGLPTKLICPANTKRNCGFQIHSSSPAMLPEMCPNTHSLWETTLLQLPSPFDRLFLQLYPSPWDDINYISYNGTMSYLSPVFIVWADSLTLRTPTRRGIPPLSMMRGPPESPLHVSLITPSSVSDSVYSHRSSTWQRGLDK